MSMKYGPWGQPGRRIFPTGGNLNKRRFESAQSEKERQRDISRCEVREDGEHYLPGATMSMEAGERAFEQGQRYKCRGGFKAAVQTVWATVVHMGMYSSDPTIARQAIVMTAREELGRQREITTQQRADDRARDDERMSAMAQHMARAMFDEADRRRSTA